MEGAGFDQFGTAPVFVTMETSAIENGDQHHARGGYNPLKALDNHIDAVIGIGAGSLSWPNQSDIMVHRDQKSGVSPTIYTPEHLQRDSVTDITIAAVEPIRLSTGGFERWNC